MNPTTEFHYMKAGLLVSWGHRCGHLGNPMYYDTTGKAEAARSSMEARDCWECLHTTPACEPAGQSLR